MVKVVAPEQEEGKGLCAFRFSCFPHHKGTGTILTIEVLFLANQLYCSPRRLPATEERTPERGRICASTQAAARHLLDARP